MSLKVSVVIPVRNGAPFIREAVESVLAQEGFSAHEIIVVDDGSTDDTPVILESFKDKIIRKRIPASGGPAEPRNAGIRMATGDWIAFLDADDLWFKRKLRRQAEVIERCPEVGFICCNFLNFDPTTGKTVEHFRVLRRHPAVRTDEPFVGHPLRTLLWNNFVGTSTVLMSRDAIQRTGYFNPEYVNSQDFDYWARASFYTRFYLSSEVLGERRKHARNWSADPLANPSYKRRILQGLLKDHYPDLAHDGLAAEVKGSMARNNYKIGNIYFDRGQKARAFRFYWQGLRDCGGFVNAMRFLKVFISKLVRLVTFDRVSGRAFQKAEIQ